MARLIATAWMVLIASSAWSGETQVQELDLLPSGEWSHPVQERLVLRRGTRNAGWNAQEWVCTWEELRSRQGACAQLPSDSKLERNQAVFVTDAVSAGGDCRGESSGPGGLCLYAGSGNWRYLHPHGSKNPAGAYYSHFVKSAEAQGNHVALKSVNAAQGDLSSVAILNVDLVGAQAGGDEGQQGLYVLLRDTLPGFVPTGQNDWPIGPGDTGFFAKLTSSKELHDEQATPRRLLVWHEAPRIPFDVAVAGRNPAPRPPDGGATWVLEEPLPFETLPGSLTGQFGIERTDWCATLDGTRHSGDEFNYLLVSRFDGPRQFTTHRLHQGQNVGIPDNHYVNGYATTDLAVNDGQGRGHLIPCALVAGYDPVKQEFSIAPVVDSEFGEWAYKLPAMGTSQAWGAKFTIDNRLGSSGARTGVLINALDRAGMRPGTNGLSIAGHWENAIVSYDSDVMLIDTHHGRPKPVYTFAELRGRSTSRDHQIKIVYEEPMGDGVAELRLPHVQGQSAFAVSSAGRGAPRGSCEVPGIQRYYDLSADQEWICRRDRTWGMLGSCVSPPADGAGR